MLPYPNPTKVLGLDKKFRSYLKGLVDEERHRRERVSIVIRNCEFGR